MDDISIEIKFKGVSGKLYFFVHCYDLIKETIPGSEGIYVFTKGKNAESASVLDVQLLISKDEIDSTVERMKEDGALFAFFKECDDELACDAEIDDIKGGDDFRKSVE